MKNLWILLVVFGFSAVAMGSDDSDGPNERCAEIIEFPVAAARPSNDELDPVKDILEEASNIIDLSDFRSQVFVGDQFNLDPEEKDALFEAASEGLDRNFKLSESLVSAVRAMLFLKFKSNNQVNQENVERHEMLQLNRYLREGVHLLMENLGLLMEDPAQLDFFDERGAILTDKLSSIMGSLSLIFYVSADSRFPKPTEFLENDLYARRIPVLASSALEAEFHGVPRMFAENHRERWEPFWKKVRDTTKSDDDLNFTMSTLLGITFLDYEDKIKAGKKEKDELNGQLTGYLEWLFGMAKRYANNMIYAGDVILHKSIIELDRDEAAYVVESIGRWLIQYTLAGHNMERALTVERAVFDSTYPPRFWRRARIFESMFEKLPHAELEELRQTIIDKYGVEDKSNWLNFKANLDQ